MAAGTLLLLVSVLAVVRQIDSATCHASFAQGDFPNCVQLHPTVCVHWALEGDNVTFALDVDGSPAWIGFGLSEAGGMKGADIYILETNEWHLRDYHSLGFEQPRLDNSQDVVLLNPPASNGDHTLAVIQRKRFTCDVNDTAIVEGAWHPLIWAYGDKWPSWHGPHNRGNGGAVLVQSSAPSPPSPEAGSDDRSQTFDVLLSNVDIPAQSTAYMCRDFEVPHDKKYHVVRYDPIATSKFIHHIALFYCSRPLAQLANFYECGTMVQHCETFMMAWTPGVGPITAPPQAGFAIGGDGGVVDVVLQIHYTNPDRLEGLKDSSGFRLYYTDQLRPHDLGVLVLGQTSLAIPPGEPAYVASPTVCPSECTQNFTEPLHLIGSFYHMHELGSKLVTQHIRDGKELPPLGRRNDYDFNFQGLISIPPESATLQPGDTLVTTCTFDSTSRTRTTHYGPATTDEMCFNLVFYYPRQRIDICGSNDRGLAVCMDAELANQYDRTQHVTTGFVSFMGIGAMAGGAEGMSGMGPSAPAGERPMPAAESEVGGAEAAPAAGAAGGQVPVAGGGTGEAAAAKGVVRNAATTAAGGGSPATAGRVVGGAPAAEDVTYAALALESVRGEAPGAEPVDAQERQRQLQQLQQLFSSGNLFNLTSDLKFVPYDEYAGCPVRSAAQHQRRLAARRLLQP